MTDGAFYTGEYVNLLGKLGLSQTELDARVQSAFDTIFFDPTERFYHEVDPDSACMVDTGNNDARTEGMSYGMMMCVQMNRRDIFDKLWMFSKRYMWHAEGKYQGYFAWSCALDGTRNAQGPAPDGEEYYAMALMFAHNRWGDGEPPFDYLAQARDILRHCVHQDELAGGCPMWTKDGLIKFIPESPYSDPSYHLPHFYELFSLYADERDRAFWRRAAYQSRLYWQRACHAQTGLAAEYAHFDGTPEHGRGHGNFYSDAYRVAMNIGLDASWFGQTAESARIIDRLQAFFAQHTDGKNFHVYTVDGQTLDEPALHPVAIVATNAAGSLATHGANADACVRAFANTPLRKGERRYYDNCLYFFCLLMLAGRYRIY